MPSIRLDLPHEGETFDEAVDDIQRRYGVTVTLINEQGPNGWPEVELSAGEQDRLIAATRGGWDYDDDELRELGLLVE